jgi:hypothetical protein
LAHELLHAFKSKRGKGGFLFMKMDMEKAFDIMEWSFLLAILEKLGSVKHGSLGSEYVSLPHLSQSF